MAKLLTSLENELELQAIQKNNNLAERQCANFEKQRDEIYRSLRHLESCNSQVKRMGLIIKDKSEKVRNDVEIHQIEAQKVAQRSFASLNSSFEHIDLIRAMNHLSFHYGSPVLNITLPYETCIQAAIQEENKMRSTLEEISILKDNLNTDKECVAKAQQAILKAKGKAEKDIMKLQEELEHQNGITSIIQSSSTEINNKLQNIRKQMADYASNKAVVELEMIESEKIRDALMLQMSENVTSTVQTLATLNDVYTIVTAGTPADVLPSSNIPDFEEISHLFDEWKTLTAENNDFPGLDAIADNETSNTLEASLGSFKKDVKQIVKSIEQMKDYNAQLSVVNEELMEKKSEMKNVRNQIAENTSVLAKWKVTENAVKITSSESRSSKREEILRRLEATRNDIPGPVPYQPYQTPGQDGKSAKDDEELKTKVLKRSSASGSSRNISKTGPHYPGIKLITKESAKTTPSSHKDVSEESDMSISIDNSSRISELSGTTQDESQINGFFGYLSNERPASPPVVEFSMADHMTEFSQRQAKIKANRGTDVDVDDDENTDVEVKPLDELDISAIDSDGDDVEDLDEEDNDLYAPDDQELDQSTWGDDD